ncbi:MAG TPA: hypothetical protein VN541_14640, partial [Tepidisphaeraceae bacterium]|nr:hypothetical protein [Tepidisphaeraceae bacterium]
MHQASSSVAVPVEPPVQAGPVEIPQQLAAVKKRVLDPDPEFRHYEKSSSLKRVKGLVNYQFAVGDQPHPPDVVFERLRWGGQFVYVSDRKRDVAELPAQFAERGFVTVHGPAFVRTGWGIPLISKKAHFFIARKTLLVPPREFSDRFTYQVELERRNVESDGPPGTENWVVRKEIPAFERILARLKFKAPQLPQTTLERRAQKFAEQIFPLFLTREAAMLRIIERDCPRQYLSRFPRIVHMEKDGKGYVRRLWTTWLRNGGRQLSHIEFAKQAAELLHILHERVGIIHLDLRMDNMVITEHGVGFIDFGSAV